MPTVPWIELLRQAYFEGTWCSLPVGMSEPTFGQWVQMLRSNYHFRMQQIADVKAEITRPLFLILF